MKGISGERGDRRSEVEVNRAGEMAVFVAVVDRGGFSAAARSLAMTPSAISKLVGRLEARLAVPLLRRTTRQMQLTAEGETFYARGVRLLADLDEAERSVQATAAPRGRVSVNCSVSFGHRKLLPLLPALCSRYPELRVDVVLTDRVVDLVEERADIAIRWGQLPVSDVVARPLGRTAQHIVGSPAYLKRHGVPRNAEALLRHPRLGTNYRRMTPHWPLQVGGQLIDMPIDGPVRASDGEALRQMALAGLGLARLSRYHIWPDLEAGRLVPVLEAANPGEFEPIHAVWMGRPGRLPARIRALLDFLVEQVDLSDGERPLPR